MLVQTLRGCIEDVARPRQRMAIVANPFRRETVIIKMMKCVISERRGECKGRGGLGWGRSN